MGLVVYEYLTFSKNFVIFFLEPPGVVMVVLRGWIQHNDREDTRESATDLLRDLGITLGPYFPHPTYAGFGQFDNCVVPDEALEKLNPYWGRFVWGLEPEGV